MVEQAALFGEADPSGEQRCMFRVGDRFEFKGLPGQEVDPSPLVGSPAPGWLIEVVALGLFGSLGIRCGPTLDEKGTANVGSVRFSDAVAMVSQGAWVRLS